MNAGELDGIIIAENARSEFAKSVIKTCKFYEIPQVGIIDLAFPNPVLSVLWLDTHKIFLPYLESDITDECNLKCRGCYHFANFPCGYDIYPVENFLRDVRQISKTCDVSTFRLLGGEPLLLENLRKYIRITRRYFPKSNLGIVTNGLLLPSTSKRTFDTLRENNVVVYISGYPPTLQVLDKIKSVLEENKITYRLHPVEKFLARMTLNNNHDPSETRRICSSDVCRSMLNGKIYKCPIDAFCFKFPDKFGIKDFPKPTGVDICAPNFSSMLERLDKDVELCHWCSEKHRQVLWQPSNNNPKLEDWLADPAELKNFL